MPDGELLIVATDELSGFAIKTYGLRWEIETLFACLKSKGFNFEDTHITKPERIEIKKHGRKAVSNFSLWA